MRNHAEDLSIPRDRFHFLILLKLFTSFLVVFIFEVPTHV
jgi:hypothetical protein